MHAWAPIIISTSSGFNPCTLQASGTCRFQDSISHIYGFDLALYKDSSDVRLVRCLRFAMPPPLPPSELGHSLGPRDARVTLGGHLDYVVRGPSSLLFPNDCRVVVAIDGKLVILPGKASLLPRSVRIRRKHIQQLGSKLLLTTANKVSVSCSTIKCNRE